MARNWGPIFDKNLEYASRQPKEPPKGPKSPKGTPKASKWTPKGSQMEPKWDQMDPAGSQMEPKGNQMEPKVAPRGQAIYSQTPDPPPKRPTSI